MISTNHELFDDRIYWKETLSLKKHGYEVFCIAISDKDESGITDEGIKYYKIKPRRKKYKNVFIRSIFYDEAFGYETYEEIFNIAKKLECNVYHFHDLYLNLIGKKLKKLSFKPKVIYDVHECYPEQIREYRKFSGFKKIINNIYSYFIRFWEVNCSKYYDYVITTESSVNKKFSDYIGENKVDIIYNYANFDVEKISSFDEKEFDAIYCGGINRIRSAMELLEVANIAKKQMPNFKLLFLGPISGKDLEKDMKNFIEKNKLQNNVILKGKVPYPEVEKYYLKSKIGLAIFKPSLTFRKTVQIKTFEYMAFGLPMVGSNFGNIQKYINEADTGITVDPLNPSKIWNAIYIILNDRNLYNKYSYNGVRAVKEEYNWSCMEVKLLTIYNEITNNDRI
ncbi:glycosyltransferase family 4 protein [Clostridium sp. ZS2-4]|uniref:glycosyltransferase family 4 protein n=1 Tax=Clostridium sp. ZS2-4 TaxID=2987703 RepID=UPI00227CB5BD|nr:glycosyltransferase family 4 protein [Clostridium sp. ZS2-4]MCY6353979.1 glycosyltransferase family 4 protein [Clostridium sp. ZS2-4]